MPELGGMKHFLLVGILAAAGSLVRGAVLLKDEPRSWNEALRFCRVERGQLAQPTASSDFDGIDLLGGAWVGVAFPSMATPPQALTASCATPPWIAWDDGEPGVTSWRRCVYVTRVAEQVVMRTNPCSVQLPFLCAEDKSGKSCDYQEIELDCPNEIPLTTVDAIDNERDCHQACLDRREAGQWCWSYKFSAHSGMMPWPSECTVDDNDVPVCSLTSGSTEFPSLNYLPYGSLTKSRVKSILPCLNASAYQTPTTVEDFPNLQCYADPEISGGLSAASSTLTTSSSVADVVTMSSELSSTLKATPSMSKATPSMSKATPTMSKATPSMSKATPTMSKATPTTNMDTPIPSKTTPITSNATLTMSEATPTTKAATPTTKAATPTTKAATPTEATTSTPFMSSADGVSPTAARTASPATSTMFHVYVTAAVPDAMTETAVPSALSASAWTGPLTGSEAATTHTATKALSGTAVNATTAIATTPVLAAGTNAISSEAATVQSAPAVAAPAVSLATAVSTTTWIPVAAASTISVKVTIGSSVTSEISPSSASFASLLRAHDTSSLSVASVVNPYAATSPPTRPCPESGIRPSSLEDTPHSLSKIPHEVSETVSPFPTSHPDTPAVYASDPPGPPTLPSTALRESVSPSSPVPGDLPGAGAARPGPRRLCSCTGCRARGPSSAEGESSKAGTLASQLAVERKALSATKRKLTSAPDPRTSSKAIGCFALFAVTVLPTVLFVLDLPVLVRHAMHAFAHLKRLRGMDGPDEEETWGSAGGGEASSQAV